MDLGLAMRSGQATADGGASTVSKSAAVLTCAAMTFLYVAILYSPTLILRLPPPSSFNSFMVRRFVCAAISSVVSLFVCALVLPINGDLSSLFGAYGIRRDHIWEAVVVPLSLTSLMYSGSFLLKYLLLWNSWIEHGNHRRKLSRNYLKTAFQGLVGWIVSVGSSVSAWRIYFVAPVTEELVFRACMIPLLLCGGFRTYTVVLLSPVFFSLAHLNHLLEFYTQQDCSLLKALMTVGFQLGYTVIFGSFASFLFIRTGHFAAPLVAHMFCNFMGLPVILSRRTGMVAVAFLAGLGGFLYLLFPLTSPSLFNDRTDNCKCWHRYCDWV